MPTWLTPGSEKALELTAWCPSGQLSDQKGQQSHWAVGHSALSTVPSPGRSRVSHESRTGVSMAVSEPPLTSVHAPVALPARPTQEGWQLPRPAPQMGRWAEFNSMPGIWKSKQNANRLL